MASPVPLVDQVVVGVDVSDKVRGTEWAAVWIGVRCLWVEELLEEPIADCCHRFVESQEDNLQR